jgi:hypothetical protein
VREPYMHSDGFDFVFMDNELWPESTFGTLGKSSDWPDPRILYQNKYWCGPDGVLCPLDQMDVESMESLLSLIIGDVKVWHQIAADFEMLTMSTAMQWAYEELNIPFILDLYPDSWLESTELYRELEDRIFDAE